MLSDSELVEEILRLQNLVLYLQAQLQEARKMANFQGPNMNRAWLSDVGTKLDAIIASECDVADELLIVIMEDEPVHTDDRPFCGDMTCGCHRDRTLIREHLVEPRRSGMLTWYEERLLWQGRMA